jgi:hypothetical protein
VFRHEIDETAKTLRLWVQRKRGNRKLICSGCGRKFSDAHDYYQRDVRDLQASDHDDYLQHANKAIDEVRRAELIRKGGRTRGVVKGTRWLLLRRSLNLDQQKRAGDESLPLKGKLGAVVDLTL